jgi:S2P endopeptidase
MSESFVAAVLVLVFLWASIHAIRHYVVRRTLNSLLPSISNNIGRGSLWHTSTTQVFLNSFHLRLQTTAWNIYHDILSTEFKNERNFLLSRTLMIFYDLGSIFGVLGMLSGLLLLLWTCGLCSLSLATKISRYSNTINTISSSVATGFAKRGLDAATGLLPEHESFIKPIVM